jgi:hypothetical protein
MKRISTFILGAMIAQSAIAQDLGDVRKYAVLGDFVKAKDAIDKVAAAPKTSGKPETWYWKGYVYNALAKDEKTKGLCADCRMEGFEALKKYQEMDPASKELVGEQYVTYFDMYNGFFDQGAKAYSAKDYNGAFEAFQKALTVQTYVYNKKLSYNNFSFPELDTSLVLNTALSARLAKKDADAVTYYSKLANARLGGESYLEMYQYMTEYFIKNNDKAALEKTLATGKSLYPENEYWTEVELESVDRKDKPTLFAKYEEVISKNPGKYTLAYNYSVELFNYMYVGDVRPADFDARRVKLEEMLKSAISLKPNSPDASLLMARHLYNDVYDLQDAGRKIKGTKPEDAKKRVEVRNKALKVADECIQYAATSAKLYSELPKLKPVEKANYKNSYSILESMYGFKGDNAKAADYRKQAEAIQ